MNENDDFLEEDELQEMQQKKQQKKSFWNNKKTVKGKALSAWLVTIIVIFMLITFGLGMFLGKELFSEKKESENKNDDKEVVDNSKEEKENNTRIDLDINDETVQKLFEIFRYDKEHCFLIDNALNTSNTARIELAYILLDDSYRKTRTCSDLTPVLYDETDSRIAPHYCGKMSDEMSKYYSNNKEAFEKATLNNNTEYVEAVNIHNKFNEIFSSDYTYKDESFVKGMSGAIMQYYADKGIYALYNWEAGGICNVEVHVINSAYKIGNSLFLETTLDQTKINYEFRLEDGKYKFVKVVEIK